MRNIRVVLLWVLSFTTLALTTGCEWPDYDDDDMVSPTPIPATPTPEPMTPTPLPPQTTISGTVTAVDRDTGEPLDTATYAARAGVIVVYALTDPADLVYPLGKATLEQPGFYSMDVPAGSGQIYVVAAVDMDGNRVISPYDMTREAVLSPVSVSADPIGDVDIVIDLASRGGGGVAPERSTFEGVVTYDADIPANIAVVAYRGDYAGWYWGMTKRFDSGDYAVSIGMYGSTTALVGYADADGNNVFEPCDPAGLPEGNPFDLIQAGRNGVDILIEGVGPVGLPVPVPYISVSGTISTDDSYADTPILLTLTGAQGALTFASKTLNAPGEFTIRVPGNLSDVTLFAITDSNGDGNLDAAVDANDALGPFDVGTSSVGAKNLTLTLPIEPDTGFSGTIEYTGSVGENDKIVVAVFTDPTMMAGPYKMLTYPAVFPAFYEVLELGDLLKDSSLTSSSFYVAAALDVGGNFSGEPGEDDIMGAYTVNGSSLEPIKVDLGKVVTGVDFPIGNWSQ